MKKVSKLLIAVVAAVCLGSNVSLAFADELPEGSDADAKVIIVDSSSDLSWLSSNASTYNGFAGYTIKITDDINLENQQWNPIEDFSGAMIGDKEGSNPVISGLTVTGKSTASGLCANASGASFSNLTIKGAVISTSGEYAGAFAGDGFTSSFTNCKAINVKITGKRFVGGIVGSAYGNITNCTVKSEDSGECVISAYSCTASLVLYDGDNIGGIIGYVGEGNTRISKCTVDGVTVKGARQVGGIAGLENYGNTITECNVLNSSIKSESTSSRIWISNRTPGVGGLVGQFNAASDSETIILTGNLVKDTTITQASYAGCYSGWAVGDATYGSSSNNYTVNNSCEGTVTVKWGSATLSPGSEIGHA